MHASVSAGVHRRGSVVLAVSTLTVVALQIVWPLTHSDVREQVTVAIVVGFAAVCVLHVGVTRGPAQALTLLAVTAVPGFLVEVLGVHTGVPFGAYTYSDVFGTPPRAASRW